MNGTNAKTSRDSILHYYWVLTAQDKRGTSQTALFQLPYQDTALFTEDISHLYSHENWTQRYPKV